MSRFRRFFSRWQNWIGFLLILLYVGVAVFAPYLSPNDPANPSPFIEVGRRTLGEPQPPDEKAPLGMLPFGIDVYHALVWGSRDALVFGLVVTISTAVFGVVYGAVSGFTGNRLGSFMLRVADAFLAFPPLAGVVLLQQLFLTSVDALGGYFSLTGEIYTFAQNPIERTLIQSLVERIDPLMLSLIVFSWMPYARLVHAIVLTLKQTEFVQASRALGGSSAWIIRKHLLRNSTGPAIVLAARDVGGVVLLQATLTFIQIGGGSVWGEMLAQGRNWIIGPGGSLFRYWWVFIPPTLAVMLFGIAWNMFGDSLNDILEPTSHQTVRRRWFWDRIKKKGGRTTLPEADVLTDTTPLAAPSILEPVPPLEFMMQTSASNGADRILLTAREDLASGDLPRALHAYQHLIQRNRLVSEVLPDLAQLVKKFPRDPDVWQALGDALARAGQPEHAAQSYERAEKLQQQNSSELSAL